MFWLIRLAGHCIQKGQHCSSPSHPILSLVLDEVTMQPVEELDLLGAWADSVLVSWFLLGSLNQYNFQSGCLVPTVQEGGQDFCGSHQLEEMETFITLGSQLLFLLGL